MLVTQIGGSGQGTRADLQAKKQPKKTRQTVTYPRDKVFLIKTRLLDLSYLGPNKYHEAFMQGYEVDDEEEESDDD